MPSCIAVCGKEDNRNMDEFLGKHMDGVMGHTTSQGYCLCTDRGAALIKLCSRFSAPPGHWEDRPYSEEDEEKSTSDDDQSSTSARATCSRHFLQNIKKSEEVKAASGAG